jgi:hypothetical protein
MIVSKTRMTKLPTSCKKCPYYEPSNRFNYFRSCRGNGHSIEIDEKVKPTVERPDNCPLMEI